MKSNKETPQPLLEAYEPIELENNFQKIWNENKTFEVDVNKSLPKYYVLEMFPYPSGNIHMGHIRNYAIGDVIARYKRSLGYNVLHPMGWDSFGLPAENAAKEHHCHPSSWTYNNIAAMREELKGFGFGIDWRREVITSEPSYYAFEQKVFIELYKAGLAYKKETLLNWDPVENCVLANEQVIDGKGWRSGALVEQKKVNQWFLKITDFANDLLAGLTQLKDWPPQVITMQNNWIKKSVGATVCFNLHTPAGEHKSIQVFTTKPHTIFGATFIGISKEHPVAEELAENDLQVSAFIKEVHKQEVAGEHIKTKEGVFSGIYAVHPFSKKLIPVYITNFVLANYGSGAVMGVPAHDLRDHEFAQKYDLPVIFVIAPNNQADINPRKVDESTPYLEKGIMVNSEFLDGLSSEEAKESSLKHLTSGGYGEYTETFNLKDWGISRQRYWGCPIPIVYCKTCGIVPEDPNNLPIKLPEDVDLSSTTGNPLDAHPTWKHTKCPQCAADAVRETDTFDTFVESSWYFLKYATLTEEAFDADKIAHWLPVDHYIGGIEHAIMHLLYSRFFTRVLNHLGCIKGLKEPFKRLTTQGMVCHRTYKSSAGWEFPADITQDESGTLYSKATKLPVKMGSSEKMSKSKKNVISPSVIKEKYGVDTARLFVLSDAPPTKDLEWNLAGVEGTFSFLNKLWKLALDIHSLVKKGKTLLPEQLGYINSLSQNELKQEDLELIQNTQRTIVAYQKNIEGMLLNKAIANIRELYNSIYSKYSHGSYRYLSYSLKVLLQLLNPFAPHITEELWNRLKYSIALLADEAFPSTCAKFLSTSKVVVAVQVNGKTRATLEVAKDTSQEELLELIKDDLRLQKFIEGKPFRKVIYVTNKILNLVI